MTGTSNKRVTEFRLTAACAQTRVRQLASDSANLVFTDHMEERMLARGIDTDAVLRILRTGEVEEDPTESERRNGDWKIKLTRKMATGRVAGVVTVLVQSGRLILLTAEWEDGR